MLFVYCAQHNTYNKTHGISWSHILGINLNCLR